jgi:hypothetical protein
MRVLIIDSHAKEEASKVVKFASRPENLYRPGVSPKPPGDVREHILFLGDYKIVFSLTRDPGTGEVYRHLSMSVPTRGAYPHPAAVTEVISLFGFEGGLSNCQLDANKVENCITVAQGLEP